MTLYGTLPGQERDGSTTSSHHGNYHNSDSGYLIDQDPVIEEVRSYNVCIYMYACIYSVIFFYIYTCRYNSSVDYMYVHVLYAIIAYTCRSLTFIIMYLHTECCGFEFHLRQLIFI